MTHLIRDISCLPNDIQFVWHGINDRQNLQRFLESPVEWGETDVRWDRVTETLVCRHDPLPGEPNGGVEEFLRFEEFLRAGLEANRSFKLDLKEGGHTLDILLASIAQLRLPENVLWFNATLDDLSLGEFRILKAEHPSAIRQCPIGDIVARRLNDESGLHEDLQTLANRGLTRFSLHWNTGQARRLAELLPRWGFQLNIYGIPDLRAFLETINFHPASITADFDFPEWNLHGRGSGEGGICLSPGE